MSAVTDNFWPNFKFRFLGLSWWHLCRQHMSWQHLSLSRISQLLLTQFFAPGNYLDPILDLIFLDPKYWDLIFFTLIFSALDFLGPNLRRNWIFWDQNFFLIQWSFQGNLVLLSLVLLDSSLVKSYLFFRLL